MSERRRIYERAHRVVAPSLCPVSLLPDRRRFHDDDDDIARRAAATSIRMNTAESITVPIGGADRREKRRGEISICIGSPRH